MRDGKVYGGLYPDTGSFGVFGGGVDPGETPEQAALREFQEESGLTATNARLLPIPPLEHEWKPPYSSAKQALRAKDYRGSRTHYVVADLGDYSMKGQAEEQRKNERLYDLSEAIALASNSSGTLAAPNSKRKQVLEHLLAMHQAQAIKKASAGAFKTFKCEHSAGTRVQLVSREDDEDEDYPLQSITYPVDYGTLPGHIAEDGEELNVAAGSSGDLHGKFTVKLPDSFKKETKFYSGLDERDRDQLLRAYAPVLVSHDELDEDSLVGEVSKFRAK
jgi:ADP-ribose pyrophosphatase YjhB (NUDIX family)